MTHRLVVPVLVLAAAAGCARTRAASPPGRSAVPVAVATAARRDVPQRIDDVGTVEAKESVAIRPQVGGEVVAVAFEEGSNVRRGDLLFRIDPRPYEAALSQSEAVHAREEAQSKNAAAEAERAEALFEQGVLSREQHDAFVAQARSQEAAAQADAAGVRTARLNVAYTELRAPIAGRTGSVLVHVGNIVKANDDNPLVVINRVDPIYVSFALPEQQLATLRGAESAHRLAAEAVVAGDPGGPVIGHLSFMDNQVDRQTGTIRLKAEFPNRDGRLWPGQFVTLRLTLGVRSGATVVPSEAVQAGQKGSYVFVVRPDHTVELRTVTAGLAVEGQTIVENGLAPGDVVVVDGQMNLTSGSRVSVR